ncbi:S-locus-specific glycoprotein S13-like [Panicum virgatum]|uniref:S-locus-specific glycoprotein S13-like n=1 Tax=Panicum virgatum TaxID=38727 RepID=UPI0019D64606|nr:S-locus-specific glycoprotein S13-like [Panicum virgatum]
MGLASRSTVLLLLSWVSLCISADQLSPAKPLTFPDGKLISNNGVFALGFFSPTNSSTPRFYIGIWYNNDPERTVVWVANRDSPIVTPSSATLAVTNRSDLVLSDTQGRIYWTTTNNITTTGRTAAAMLDDKGNLVLRSSQGATLWQSFDHPTDTILPGMPVWVNYRTRFTQSQLVSWRSPEDPSAGNFSLGADASSGIQYVLKDGPRLLWRSGAWNGEMVLDYTPNNASTVIIMSIVTNGDDISLMFSVSDGSPSMYVRVASMGRYEFTVWNRTAAAWAVLEAHPGAGCDRYAACGPFGYCDATEASPACKCLDGFGASPSGGCTRREPLQCGGGDYFATLPGVKTPAMPVFVRNRSFDGCTAECRGNCSCTAYAYTNLSTAISGGHMSRCLLWFG